MDRRNFFKILSTASTGVVAGACGKKIEHIPLLVSDQELVPGEEAWHPGICGECDAGCGVIARVMEGERVIERKGEKFRQRIAVIKKLEGNPLDSATGGRLCARGQAAVQSLHHPGRVRGPLHRRGARGEAKFAAISWDQAIASAAEKLRSDPSRIVFLTRPRAGTRALTIARFLQALGAPPPVTFEIADFPIERKAAQQVYGWDGLPVHDLAGADYALGIGADFLGTWVSPVYYGRQFGHFRQGRPGVRGRLAHAESRLSITAQSADQWIPLRPGCELPFALAIGRLLLGENQARSRSLSPGVLKAFESADIGACGVEEKSLRRIARDLGEAGRPVVIAGASVVQTNSLAAVTAANYLNVLLDNAGKGVRAPAPDPTASRPAYRNPLPLLERARVVFLDDVNPVYTLSARLDHVETVISFSSILNDSDAYADLVLPDHHSLETAAAVFAPVAPAVHAAVATPFVEPLHDTRATEQVLAEIARQMNVTFEPATPEKVLKTILPPEQTWGSVVRQGGFWDKPSAVSVAKPQGDSLEAAPVAFIGDASQFPLNFLPYASVQFYDGRNAHLPWLQELPDPVSSAMWGLPVEIDPQTASRLGISTGDRVRVESPRGKLEAPAYVDPAAIPGVVSMAMGQGHRHGRGANPLSILAPVWEQTTGALAFGATRVRVARLDRNGGLIQFAAVDRELGPWGKR